MRKPDYKTRSLVILSILLLILAVLIWSHPVSAGSWGGFPVIGFQYEIQSGANDQFFCKNSGDLVAHPYIRQPLYTHKGFSWVASANHKSCGFGEDTASYDAIGTGFELDTCWIFDKCR